MYSTQSHNSLGSSYQGLAQPGMLGYFRRRDNALWLFVLPIRLARPRKGYPADHHPIQSHRTQRSAVLQCIPSSGSCRTRFALPFTLHGGRVPSQDRLHDFVAGSLPLRL